MRRYILKVELDSIEPLIWRRIVVPAHISLDRLHDVIQIVMGWFDYHLHEFAIGTKLYTHWPEDKEDGLESAKYLLEDLLKRKGRTFSYRYDFGDDWTHTLTLEQVIEEDEIIPELSKREEFGMAQEALLCIDGARACPPEDVGGIFGYKEFCEAMAHSNHPDHKESAAWYNSIDFFRQPFDPEFFDKEKINFELNKYLRWSRDRIRFF